MSAAFIATVEAAPPDCDVLHDLKLVRARLKLAGNDVGALAVCINLEIDDALRTGRDHVVSYLEQKKRDLAFVIRSRLALCA